MKVINYKTKSAFLNNVSVNIKTRETGVYNIDWWDGFQMEPCFIGECFTEYADAEKAVLDNLNKMYLLHEGEYEDVRIVSHDGIYILQAFESKEKHEKYHDDFEWDEYGSTWFDIEGFIITKEQRRVLD